MKNIWAPWRFKYVTKAEPKKGCLFCRVVKESQDKENYIIDRKKNCFIMLNLYPYNNGHLMIIPYDHVATLDALSTENLTELFETVAKACQNIKTEMSAEGFNIGINIGSIAGAGVADHIHVHIVPRWSGDTNFMPVIGDVKVISEALDDSYERLKKYSY